MNGWFVDQEESLFLKGLEALKVNYIKCVT